MIGCGVGVAQVVEADYLLEWRGFMYFSMDELGFENNEKIATFNKSTEKWSFISETARGCRFDGIHVTPSLYKSFGLDINEIPDYFDQFHLTFHLGGSHRVLQENECSQFQEMLDNAFRIASKHNVRDISLHPPVIEGCSAYEKECVKDNFSKIIEKWTANAKKMLFTLSLETHLYEPYFLFGNYVQYRRFSDEHPEMGILIDVSHNFFSGYSENEIIETFRKSNVTSLHISDAKQNLDDKDLAQGTHLAIGDGEIDFKKIVTEYAQNSSLFAVLEIKAENGKLEKSLCKLRQYIF